MSYLSKPFTTMNYYCQLTHDQIYCCYWELRADLIFNALDNTISVYLTFYECVYVVNFLMLIIYTV